MRIEHLKYLVDPVSGKNLEILKKFEENGDHVVSGLLKSDTDWYPIVNGVPRIMIGELKSEALKNHLDFYFKFEKKLPKEIAKEWQKEISDIADLDKFMNHQKKTAESFAFEWKHIYRENNYEKENFLHFVSPYLTDKDFKNEVTVDIGCGSGRFTKTAALFGAKIAYGADLGESVQVAFEMTKQLENACIVQADIYNMPFKKSVDIAYSIGVLHHLPNPEEGFLKLQKLLRLDSTMLIWVYNRRNNNRALYIYEPLRSVARHIPKPILLSLCYFPAGIVQLFNLVTIALKKVGASKAAESVPFYYYANFPFNMKLNDAFDVLATPKSNYYLVEQITRWFKHAKLKNIEAYEHREAGITCKGLASDK